jgi:hypothetical protein
MSSLTSNANMSGKDTGASKPKAGAITDNLKSGRTLHAEHKGTRRVVTIKHSPGELHLMLSEPHPNIW